MKLFEKLKELLKSNRKEISLKFDDEFLYYMHNETIEEQLPWGSVLEIFAFKRDQFSVDLICIGFRIDNDGLYYQVDEDMGGYKELKGFLNDHFKGINKEWFSDVAFPAFETNLLSLWGEKKTEQLWKV